MGAAMNAPLKFRVWDGEKMHEPTHDYVLSGDGDLLLCLPELETFGAEEHGDDVTLGVADDDHVVMHSTGLTDAEGTEVYEGDIVEHWSRDYSVRADDPPEGHSRIGSVKYIDAHWWVDFTDPGKMFLSDISYKDSTTQVIGNRYEDPNLLEASTA